MTTGRGVEEHAIETGRLTLRPFAEERDVAPLYAIQSDRTAMRHTVAVASMRECRDRLRAHEALRAQNGFAPWVVLLRGEGSAIGWGGLGVDPFAPGWGVEVSYFFAPAHWGRGYATELVRAALRHGFERAGLDAIGAFAHPGNSASIRVLEKCGFAFLRYEAELERNHYEVARVAPRRAPAQEDGHG